MSSNAGERVRFGLTVRHRLTWPNFHRRLLRSEKFWLQNCAIPRNTLRKRNDELPSASNGMQSSETMRNSLVLNYKSAALTS
jgi:hypothetical protein